MPIRTRAAITMGLLLVTVAPALAAVAHHAASVSGRPVGAPTRVPMAVGALFGLTSTGKLSGHFCTATVVDSPKGDVVLTAAHCLNGQTAGTFAFVPGYHNGRAPLGIWIVTKVFVDRAWTRLADPDHDYAFLVVGKKSASSLQALTGADRLGSGKGTAKRVLVVGYPSSTDVAIACRNWLREFSSTQLEFDCEGYSNGTSGSAVVVDRDPATGLGTVVGVIGGYQQGGTTQTTRALYALAAAAG
jgi:V8-like Glu-specific endopeptidase